MFLQSLVKSPAVQRQRFLNSSAAIAFSDLLRMTQVSDASAHIRYPEHIYGRVAPKNEKALNDKYIPYFAEQMKNAIAAGDSHKAQIYIQALGNTAHPKILAAFEDYLEGKKTSTQYQRLLMVTSLYHIAYIHPRLTRPVLMKIYLDTAEREDIRVAAVNNIMSSSPPAEILQMMAIATNTEPSRGVKSAVKSAIESAAQNIDPAYDEL